MLPVGTRMHELPGGQISLSFSILPLTVAVTRFRRIIFQWSSIELSVIREMVFLIASSETLVYLLILLQVLFGFCY